MKFLFIVALIALAVARPENDYDKYKNFNVDEVISNIRLLKSYVQCFLGDGKCTPEGSDFKKRIPDAVQSSCAKCSDEQKSLIAKVIRAAMKNLPEEWVKLNKLHNPNGIHDKELKMFLEKYRN